MYNYCVLIEPTFGGLSLLMKGWRKSLPPTQSSSQRQSSNDVPYCIVCVIDVVLSPVNVAKKTNEKC